MGAVLNDFLTQAHNNDGSLKDASVGSTTLKTVGGSDQQVLAKASGVPGGLAWVSRLSSAEKGAANGVATLDSTGKVSIAQLTDIAALAMNGGQELVSALTANGPTVLNVARGNVFCITLTDNAALSVSGVTPGRVCAFTVYLCQDNAGHRTVTWPANTKWSGGAPTLSTGAGAIDVVVLESIDGGATWFGSLVGTNFM